MSIKDLKFDTADFSGKDISSLPDRPGDSGITGQLLKERFDQIPKMMVALGGFNDLIDELNSTGGAENIGIAPIDGVSGTNAQAALVEMGTLTKAARAAAETAAQQGAAAQRAAENANAAADEATEKATEAARAASTAAEQGNEAAAAAVAATAAIIEVKDYAAEQAQSAKDYVDQVILAGGAVTSVFGRAGEVKAQAGDYTADMVGARPNTWMPTALQVGAIPANDKGKAGGVASLDSEGKVPTAQLPEMSKVVSVNGQTGAVVLDAEDVGAISDENGAITAELIANYTITSDKLADGSVTADKLAEGAVSPESIGAVNKAGDTMTGALSIETPASPELIMRHMGINRYLNMFMSGEKTIYLRNSADANNRTAIFLNSETIENFSNVLQLQKMVNGTANYYKIFGSHNKPSGSYTGNGSSASRTINVGGDGNIIFLSSANGNAILTAGSGFTFNSEGISVVVYASAHFANGVITLATTNNLINGNGMKVNYWCL